LEASDTILMPEWIFVKYILQKSFIK